MALALLTEQNEDPQLWRRAPAVRILLACRTGLCVDHLGLTLQATHASVCADNYPAEPTTTQRIPRRRHAIVKRERLATRRPTNARRDSLRKRVTPASAHLEDHRWRDCWLSFAMFLAAVMRLAA